MYLRESKQRRADGSTVAYLQLAENVWNAERHRSETRIVCNCGRADDPEVTERLRRLARSILRRCTAGEIVDAGGGDWRLVCAWPYGDVYVLEALWQRLGIAEVIRARPARGAWASMSSARCSRWWPTAPARRARSCTAGSSG